MSCVTTKQTRENHPICKDLEFSIRGKQRANLCSLLQSHNNLNSIPWKCRLCMIGLDSLSRPSRTISIQIVQSFPRDTESKLHYTIKRVTSKCSVMHSRLLYIFVHHPWWMLIRERKTEIKSKDRMRMKLACNSSWERRRTGIKNWFTKQLSTLDKQMILKRR